jgi:hypothetical protein
MAALRVRHEKGGRVISTEISKKISELRGLATHARSLALSLADAGAREKLLRSATELERQAAELESGGAAALPAGALPDALASPAETIAALTAVKPGTETGGEQS